MCVSVEKEEKALSRLNTRINVVNPVVVNRSDGVTHHRRGGSDLFVANRIHKKASLWSASLRMKKDGKKTG